MSLGSNDLDRLQVELEDHAIKHYKQHIAASNLKDCAMKRLEDALANLNAIETHVLESTSDALNIEKFNIHTPELIAKEYNDVWTSIVSHRHRSSTDHSTTSLELLELPSIMENLVLQFLRSSPGSRQASSTAEEIFELIDDCGKHYIQHALSTEVNSGADILKQLFDKVFNIVDSFIQSLQLQLHSSPSLSALILNVNTLRRLQQSLTSFLLRAHHSQTVISPKDKIWLALRDISWARHQFLIARAYQLPRLSSGSGDVLHLIESLRSFQNESYGQFNSIWSNIFFPSSLSLDHQSEVATHTQSNKAIVNMSCRALKIALSHVLSALAPFEYSNYFLSSLPYGQRPSGGFFGNISGVYKHGGSGSQLQNSSTSVPLLAQQLAFCSRRGGRTGTAFTALATDILSAAANEFVSSSFESFLRIFSGELSQLSEQVLEVGVSGSELSDVALRAAVLAAFYDLGSSITSVINSLSGIWNSTLREYIHTEIFALVDIVERETQGACTASVNSVRFTTFLDACEVGVEAFIEVAGQILVL